MKVSVVLERVLKSPKNRTKYYKFVSRSCEDLAEIKTVFYSLMSYQICLRCNYLICMHFFHCLILCVEDIENIYTGRCDLKASKEWVASRIIDKIR